MQFWSGCWKGWIFFSPAGLVRFSWNHKQSYPNNINIFPDAFSFFPIFRESLKTHCAERQRLLPKSMLRLPGYKPRSLASAAIWATVLFLTFTLGSSQSKSGRLNRIKLVTVSPFHMKNENPQWSPFFRSDSQNVLPPSFVVLDSTLHPTFYNWIPKSSSFLEIGQSCFSSYASNLRLRYALA